MFNSLYVLHKQCSSSGSNFLVVLFRFLFIKLYYKKSMVLHQKVRIEGLNKISNNDRLEIGVSNVGFSHRSDITYLNILGTLDIKGSYSIGRGCRINIGDKGVMKIGKGGYINCNSTFIIMHQLTIGENCIISWDCQFLDEDFHSVSYEGKKESTNAITLGDNVWVGCGAKIYKGASVASGCIVAADSVVRGRFTKENTIISGNPARVIKENVSWH